jgi:YD repeat-containing protein
MKKFLAVASFLAVAFALSGAALAQKKEAAKTSHAAKGKTASGEVSAVDASNQTLTITTKGGKAITFSYDSQTKITQAGRAAQASDIATGMRATVKYTEKDGQNWASSISLRPAKKAHSSTKAKTKSK